MMIPMSIRLCCVFTVVSLLVVAGCGGQILPEGMPKLTPVVLTVTMDGAPLDGATVGLIPLDSANSRWNAGGVTDQSGKAKIRTLAQYNGAVAGKYKVTVTKTYIEPSPEGQTYEEFRKTKRPPPVEHVHKKFAVQSSTPLELEVGSTAVDQTFEVEKP